MVGGSVTEQWPDKHFSVDSDGNISQQYDYVHSGQRAVWTFATASPANALVRQTWIYPNYVAAPYTPSYVNEMMTPLPKGMSGIFVISDSTGRTMDSTWANPAITGVFIRLKWSDIQTGPGTYDDTILLEEVDKAVANGKLYSIAVKSGADQGATPTWLFDPAPAGAGLTPVTLDWNEESSSCNASDDYGDPTDDVYRTLYLDMLSHVASVLKQNSARWRSLAYVKLSGANSMSAENRLPNGCKAGPGCICNNERWADAGYTPDGLLTFYTEQMSRIAQEFPGKSMSYPLIQSGFPRVNNEGCYMDATDTKICPLGVNTRMVGPFAQTEAIIEYARTHYGDDVAIAHLGLGPKPDFSDPTLWADGTGCPLPRDTNGNSVFSPNGVGSGCPNKWVTDVGADGGLTHFQTSHAPEVATSADLESTLQNMWLNSNSAMLEIYEYMASAAGDSVLDPALPVDEQRTLAQWNERLHERRRANFLALGDPAPTTISFTFTRSIDPYETFYYFVPKSGPQRPYQATPKLGYLNLLR